MAEDQNTHSSVEAETWKPIVGYEGVYSVSDRGIIRRDRGGDGTRAGKILNPSLTPYGYHCVGLSSLGIQKTYLVHALVLFAFVGPRPEGYGINHIDGVKTNNRLSNLEFCTPAENSRHAARLGLMASGDRHGSRTKPERVPRGDRNGSRTKPECRARGERHGSRTHPASRTIGERNPMSVLTEDDVRGILRRYAAGGITQDQLARIYGVTRPNVNLIVNRRTWKHVLVADEGEATSLQRELHDMDLVSTP